MQTLRHLTVPELESGLSAIRQAPRDAGSLLLIVRRPQEDAREVLTEGQLDPQYGLVGDDWIHASYAHDHDGSLLPDTQLTLMNVRVAALVAQDESNWPLAGDQLFVDLDLSDDNLPPGTRLSVGSAVIEITSIPHNGCKKFAARFGLDALAFISTPTGKQLHMRGIYARVVQPGLIHPGDTIRKLLD